MLQNGEPVEVAELSAHYAYEALGKIIGEEVGEEILDTVFSKFCLGK
jgi:tRNA modification GTPase